MADMTIATWTASDLTRTPRFDDSILERIVDRLRNAERLLDHGSFYLASAQASELRSIARTTRHLPRWLYSQIAQFSARASRMAF